MVNQIFAAIRAVVVTVFGLDLLPSHTSSLFDEVLDRDKSSLLATNRPNHSDGEEEQGIGQRFSGSIKSHISDAFECLEEINKGGNRMAARLLDLIHAIARHHPGLADLLGDERMNGLSTDASVLIAKHNQVTGQVEHNGTDRIFRSSSDSEGYSSAEDVLNALLNEQPGLPLVSQEESDTLLAHARSIRCDFLAW